MYIKNIYDSLKNSADRFPEKTAVIEETKTITYRQLIEKVDRLSGWLKASFHVQKGERVGLLFVNSIDFYIAFYAVAKLGAIAVMVNTKMQTEEIRFILSDTQTHCIITNARWLQKVKGLLCELGIDRVLTEVKSEEQIDGVSMDSMERIWKAWDKECYEDVKSVQDDDLTAVVLHTSGTTGKPKGIMVSHKNMMGTAYGYQDALRVSERDISVLSVPVFHILGLSCVSNLFLYMGATLVVFERFDANKALEAIEKYHATHFHSVPAVYIKLMQEATRKYNLDSLRVAVCGGAIISEEDKKAFYKMAPNASFRIAYGLTETAGSGVLSYRHGDPGKEVFNCKISVFDEASGVTKDYGEGEALCEGEIVTTKVWGRSSDDDGVLHTGDIIRKDPEGNIYILDRIKDLINRGGEKLFPSVIESALVQFPGVMQAVVFPVSHSLYGEVPAAVLVAEKEDAIQIDEIWRELPGKIGKFEIPQYIEVWKEEDIPLTGNGKIQKRKLRKIFEDKYLKRDN